MTRTGRKKRFEGFAADRHRLVAVSAVLVALGTLLGLGATAGPAGGGLRAFEPSSSLMATTALQGSAASLWSCPGPISLNRGGSGFVAVADPGSSSAKVTLRVAETALAPGELVGRPLATKLSHLVVLPGTSVVLPLSAEPVPRRDIPRAQAARKNAKATKTKAKGGKKTALPVTVEAAASLTVSGAAVGVSETATQANAVETSPCALGTSTHGYTASGLTFAASEVHLALFDPSAAPAVVNLTIGTPSGAVMPAGLQGLVVPADSLAVVDLSHYVPQQARLAVSATATVGHVVIGSLTSVAARFEEHSLGKAHSYSESGSELAVGVGSPLRRLVMAVGPTATADSEAVRLYDPARRAADVVMVTTEGKQTSRLSFTVGPGATVSEPIPVLTAPHTHGASLPGGAFSSGGSGGYVTVTTTNGVGVVAEHETVVATAPGKLTLLTSAPVIGAAHRWLVVGAVRDASFDSVISLTDAGRRGESALVEHLPAGTGSSPTGSLSSLGSYGLAAGKSSGFDVGRLAASSQAGYFSSLVLTDGPSLVTEELVSLHKLLPGVASAIPVR
jgi:hypothetical protein